MQSHRRHHRSKWAHCNNPEALRRRRARNDARREALAATLPPIERCEAALFGRMVRLGEANPAGEVIYRGYRRVRFLGHGANLHDIVFPEVEQDEPVYVVCAAALNDAGVVVGVLPLDEGHVRRSLIR